MVRQLFQPFAAVSAALPPRTTRSGGKGHSRADMRAAIRSSSGSAFSLVQPCRDQLSRDLGYHPPHLFMSIYW